jgi:hypothetical protein
MRETNLVSQRVFSSNWANGAYGPWVQYLSNQISASSYQSLVAAHPGSGYYPNDPYGFNLPSAAAPASPDYASIVGLSNPPCYFSGDIYNTLAASYYAHGDALYKNTWLNITRDMMVKERPAILGFSDTVLKASAAAGCVYPEQGGSNWGAGLTVANHIGQELFALAMIAKSLDLPAVSTARSAWSSLPLANTAPLTPAQLAQMPADTLVDIANGIANNYAPTLLKYYGAGSVRNPNQWLAGFMGPAMLTEFFPTLPSVVAMAPQVDAAAADHIAADVYADGGILEQSFNYTDTMVNDYDRLANFKSRTWSTAYRDASAQYGRQQAAISNPQGGYPQMGNGEWSTGHRAQGYTFSQTSIGFPYSGYYAQRSAWDANAAYLFFFSKRAAVGHSMAGSNAIQVAAYGRKLIMAGGSANYTNASPTYPNSVGYLSEGSTWKTSTLAVDGHAQLGGSTAGLQLNSAGKPDLTRVATTPIASRWATSSSIDFLEGTYDADYGYDPYTATTLAKSGVVHQRMVAFLRDLKAWVVVDFVLPSNTASHSYTQIWKLTPPMPQVQGTATQTEGFYPGQVNLPTGAGVHRLYTSDTTAGAVNLSIYQSSPQTLAYTQHDGASGGLYGYAAAGSVSAVPLLATDVHVNWSGTGKQVLISVLLPFSGSATDGVTRVVDATTGSIAGLDMVVNGKQVAVRASPALAALSAAGKSMALGNLLVVESDAGANPRTLYIGDSAVATASTIDDGSTVTPVTQPTGFRWTSGSGGALTANYMP